MWQLPLARNNLSKWMQREKYVFVCAGGGGGCWHFSELKMVV